MAGYDGGTKAFDQQVLFLSFTPSSFMFELKMYFFRLIVVLNALASFVQFGLSDHLGIT